MSAKDTFPYGPRRLPWYDTLSKVVIIRRTGTLLVTPPSADPLREEPFNINSASYQVPSLGLSPEEHDAALTETRKVLENGTALMLGFMESQNCHLPRLMSSPLANLMANNAGDPFNVSSPFRFSPKWIERNVLDYFASLWNAKWPHDPSDPESFWGYISMGSSEGNMHALWSARNYLSMGEGVEKQPALFFSQNANVSLSKLANIVKLPLFHEYGRLLYPNENPLGGDWVYGVPCTGGDAGPGTIDVDALVTLVDFFSGKGHPIVIVFNYGTTLKGACDNVKLAGERLVAVLKKNGMYEQVVANPTDLSKKITRKGFWFHVDGALSASYMPFLEMAYKNDMTDIEPASVFDFRLDFVSSVVTSGHKFIGTPWPTGIYLTRNRLLCTKQHEISYTGSSDTTISLSRNGHSAILLWSYISNNSYHSQVESVLSCLENVKYTLKCLNKLGRRTGLDLRILHFAPSLSILFRKPNDWIVSKYSLSTCSLKIHSHEFQFAQIYMMRHVTHAKIDSFIADLQSPDAFI